MSEETGAPAEAPSAGAVITLPAESTTPTEKPWYGEVDTDTQKYIENKGWKDPGALLKSYQNLERLRGVSADKLVKLPDFTNEKEAGEFFTRLGVPGDPTGYETPTDLPFELDAQVLASLSHGLKHTPAQHKQFAESVATYFQELQATQVAQTAERDAAEKADLEREWAGRSEENYAAAAKAAQRFGLDAETVNKIQGALGYRGTIELLTRIGRSFGEAKAPVSENSEGATPYGMTPEVAQKRIAELSRDQNFRQRLFNGDVDALKRWEDLKKIAHFQG